jgi:hypothetical protein
MPETLADQVSAVRAIAHRQVLDVVAQQERELAVMRHRLEVQAAAQRERQHELEVIAAELDATRGTLERQARRLRALAGPPAQNDPDAQAADAAVADRPTAGTEDALPGEKADSRYGAPATVPGHGPSMPDPAIAEPSSPVAGGGPYRSPAPVAGGAESSAPVLGVGGSSAPASGAAETLAPVPGRAPSSAPVSGVAESSAPVPGFATSPAEGDDAVRVSPSLAPTTPAPATAAAGASAPPAAAVDPTRGITATRVRAPGLVTGTGGRLAVPADRELVGAGAPVVRSAPEGTSDENASRTGRRRLRRWLGRAA